MAIDWQGSGYLRQRAAEKAQAEEAARQRRFEKDQSWTRLGQGVLGSLVDAGVGLIGDRIREEMPGAKLDRKYKQGLVEQGERQQGRADVRMAAEREKMSADRAAQQMKELEDRQRFGMDQQGTPAMPGIAGPAAQGPRDRAIPPPNDPEDAAFPHYPEGEMGRGRRAGEGVQGTPAFPPSPLPTVGGSQASPEQVARAAAKVKAEREAARAAAISKAQFAAAKMPLGTETVKRGRNSQTLRTQRITDAPRDPTDVTTYRVDEPMKVPAMSGGGGGKAKSDPWEDIVPPSEDLKKFDKATVAAFLRRQASARPDVQNAVMRYKSGKATQEDVQLLNEFRESEKANFLQRNNVTTGANIGSREGMLDKRLEARINAINETYDRKAAAAKTKAEYDAIEAERDQAFKLQGIQYQGQVREHGAGQTIRGITGEREGPSAGTPMPQPPAPAKVLSEPEKDAIFEEIKADPKFPTAQAKQAEYLRRTGGE